MKVCPRCLTEPAFHNAALTSRRDKAQRFILCGCDHLGDLRNWAVVKPEAREKIEAAIVARWEIVFAEYTAQWTDSQRAAYRARIYPPHSGEPWENEEWVKDTRARMLTLPGLPSSLASFSHSVLPREDEDCPFDS